MPTTIADLVEDVREALGLTPQEAQQFVLRLVPTFQVAAVSSLATTSGSQNAAFGRTTQGGVAGQFGQIQLFNPAASGTILLINMQNSMSPAPSTNGYALHNTALATLGASGWVDRRRTGTPVGQIRRDTNAVQQGAERWSALVAADVTDTVTWPSPIILEPGQGFLSRNSILNQQFTASFFWTEERE